MPKGPGLPSSRISDFYTTKERFEADLLLAEQIAIDTENTALYDLVETLQIAYNQYKMDAYLSDRQHDWIKQELNEHA